MLRTVLQAFTSRAAGPVGFALALMLCAALVATSVSARRTEQGLRQRIETLAAENQRNSLALHARLAAKEPVGFDVCARMESADRAVLETLK